jgi:hypothetical protein
MSLVSLSDAQDRVGDAITQDMIDEVEDALASLIGPLIGSRSETYFLSEARHPRWRIDGLYLSRRANAVILTNGDDDTLLVAGTDYRFLNNILIERIPAGAVWLTHLTATYEPNDEEVLRSVIFDWLTYRQTPVGLQSIRIGAYSETFFPSGTGGTTAADPVIDSLLRRILPAAGIGLTSPFRYSSGRRDRTLIVGAGS